MRYTNRLIATITLGLLSLGTVGVAIGAADDDARSGRGGWVRSRADVAPVTNARYGEECGSCHMAYQPGLLPARAWAEIMSPTALGDHYGDDASLSAALVQEIGAYLTANAADQSDQVRSRAFAVAPANAAATASSALPRISRTAYFLRKHDEIPARMVKDNPKVGGFSQCNRCHKGAAKGVYNEHQVDIPGFGPWED